MLLWISRRSIRKWQQQKPRSKRWMLVGVQVEEANRLLSVRIKFFASSGDLSKHFKRKHLRHIMDRDRLECKICQMPLQHKMHLQNHPQKVHGTVSWWLSMMRSLFISSSASLFFEFVALSTKGFYNILLRSLGIKLEFCTLPLILFDIIVLFLYIHITFCDGGCSLWVYYHGMSCL